MPTTAELFMDIYIHIFIAIFALNIVATRYLEKISQANQTAITCPKLTIKTLEQGVKCVQS